MGGSIFRVRQVDWKKKGARPVERCQAAFLFFCVMSPAKQDLPVSISRQ